MYIATATNTQSRPASNKICQHWVSPVLGDLHIPVQEHTQMHQQAIDQ